MNRKIESIKTKMFGLIGVFFIVLASLNIVYAQPNAYSFESYSKSHTVDLSTGDMSMVMPLITDLVGMEILGVVVYIKGAEVLEANQSVMVFLVVEAEEVEQVLPVGVQLVQVNQGVL